MSLKNIYLIFALIVGGLALCGTVFMVWNMVQWTEHMERLALSGSQLYFFQDLMQHACFWPLIFFLLLWVCGIALLWHWKREMADWKVCCKTIDNSRKDLFALIKVNMGECCFSFEDTTVKCTYQVVVLLQYLFECESHSITYENLNSIFGKGYYDASPSSQKKANNLRYMLKKSLKGFPVTVCPSISCVIRLVENSRADREIMRDEENLMFQ